MGSHPHHTTLTSPSQAAGGYLVTKRGGKVVAGDKSKIALVGGVHGCCVG